MQPREGSEIALIVSAAPSVPSRPELSVLNLRLSPTYVSRITGVIEQVQAGPKANTLRTACDCHTPPVGTMATDLQ